MSKLAIRQENPNFLPTIMPTQVLIEGREVKINDFLIHAFERDENGDFIFNAENEQPTLKKTWWGIDGGSKASQSGMIGYGADAKHIVQAHKKNSLAFLWNEFTKAFRADSKDTATTSKALIAYVHAYVPLMESQIKNSAQRPDVIDFQAGGLFLHDNGKLDPNFQACVELTNHHLSEATLPTLNAIPENPHSGLIRWQLFRLMGTFKERESMQTRARNQFGAETPFWTLNVGRGLAARNRDEVEEDHLALRVDTEVNKSYEARVPTSIVLIEMQDHTTDSHKKLIKNISAQYTAFTNSNLRVMGTQAGSSNFCFFLINKDGEVLLASWTAEQTEEISKILPEHLTRDKLIDRLLAAMRLTPIPNYSPIAQKYVKEFELFEKSLGLQLAATRPSREKTFFQSMMSDPGGRACFYSACFLGAAAISTAIASGVLGAAAASFAAAMANPLILGLFITAIITFVIAAAPSAFIIHEKHLCKHRLLALNHAEDDEFSSSDDDSHSDGNGNNENNHSGDNGGAGGGNNSNAKFDTWFPNVSQQP